MQTNYITLAMRTNSTLTGTSGLVSPDLLHATLGLADEHFEYAMASSWLNAVEELGDLCWFIALAANDLGCDPFAAAEGMGQLSLPLLAEAVAEFVGAVKKSYAYGADLDKAHLGYLLAVMVVRIEAITEAKGKRTLDELLAANIAKLQARYPDKFTQSDALTRDIKQEAAAMKRELAA